MIWNRHFGFHTILLVIVVIGGQAQRERCSQKGIVPFLSKSRFFKICSKDSDGYLTLKTIACGQNCYFSPEEQKCVNDVTQLNSYKSKSLDIEKAMQPMNTPDQSVMTTLARNIRCPLEKGSYCYSCDTLVSCFNNRLISIEGCKSCDPYQNKCTDEFFVECTKDNNFTCTSFGLFPDPYFCNRFHFCRGVGVSSFPFYCEPGTVYDSYLESCREDTSGKYHYYSPCPVFPKCEDDFQVGAMAVNPQFYYVCLKDNFGFLKQTIYKCGKNLVFNGNICARL